MITLNDVIKNKPEMIYYSVNTVWWTHDPDDLKSGPVPLDIFNSPLFESKQVNEYLNISAIEKCKTYGKNRVRNFMLAHAKNIKEPCDKMPQGSFDLVQSYEVFSKWCDEHMPI